MKLSEEATKLLNHMTELEQDYEKIRNLLKGVNRSITTEEILLLKLCQNVLKEMDRMADMILTIFKEMGMEVD